MHYFKMFDFNKQKFTIKLGEMDLCALYKLYAHDGAL